MSFSPLPKILIEDLARARGEVVLDLGCGDGTSTMRLRGSGGTVVGLDRERSGASAPWVRGDALAPPFRTGSCAVVVAANLYRHLKDGAAALAAWRPLLAPAGALWLLEDEPTAGDGAGALFRDLQAYLAARAPASRGPLRSLDAFQAGRGGEKGWRWGRFRNVEPVRNPSTLVEALAAAASGGDRDAARLLDRLRREPMDYGEAWWARWTREDG